MNPPLAPSPLPVAPAPTRAAPEVGCDVLGLPYEELTRRLAGDLDRPFRARQIFHSLYHLGRLRFEEMTDLGKELRRRLAARHRIGVPEVERRWVSADGTVKYLLRLADGATIEAVDIPDGDRRTFCLSSQAGCALACTFCVTGFWGAGRSLAPGEIVGQVLRMRSERPVAAGGLNLVFMGMGEPLLNLAGLAMALEVLFDLVSYRRITVSTAGVVPGIRELAGWSRRPNLAVSLHAPDDERRSRLTPINRTYPLGELLAALRSYPLERGRRVTIEYLLVCDFNDHLADADALARRLRGLSCKVNLIPVNPDPVLPVAMAPPAPARVEAFQRRLAERGLLATVRRRRGDDVAAACGQLRAPGREPRGWRGGAASW